MDFKYQINPKVKLRDICVVFKIHKYKLEVYIVLIFHYPNDWGKKIAASLRING